MPHLAALVALLTFPLYGHPDDSAINTHNTMQLLQQTEQSIREIREERNSLPAVLAPRSFNPFAINFIERNNPALPAYIYDQFSGQYRRVR